MIPLCEAPSSFGNRTIRAADDDYTNVHIQKTPASAAPRFQTPVLLQTLS